MTVKSIIGKLKKLIFWLALVGVSFLIESGNNWILEQVNVSEYVIILLLVIETLILMPIANIVHIWWTGEGMW